MNASRTSRLARGSALAAATMTLLALAGSVQAAPARHADSICKVAQSSDWKKLDAKVGEGGNAVSAAMNGTNVKDGQSAARSIADALRKESKLIAKASGNDKARKNLSEAYAKVGTMYDRVAEVLPQIASSFTAAKKGDMKSLNKVMDAMGKVLEPAASAMGNLSTSYTDAIKGC